jgi:mRNA-degrading endonuclease HigB of HigAB toxin-antitoxin module
MLVIACLRSTLEGTAIAHIAIAEINYRSGTVFVRDILTHAEYDKERWKT